VTAPISQQHRARLQPDDPAYIRLRNVTQKRLSASIQTLVRALRGAAPPDQRAALSAFVARQTGILQQAYITSHQMGAFDYFTEVSQTPDVWSQRVAVDPERMKRALSFYAPSIAKMANEALGMVNATPEMKLEEAIEGAIKLFGFHIGEPGSPRGGLGGLGHDELPGGRHAIRDRFGHYHGSTRGEHQEASVHEHLAARHHEEESGGGGPNAGAKARNPNKGVKFTREQVLDLATKANMAGKKLDLHGADLRDVDLSGMGLHSANFSGVDLRGANLTHTYIHEANLVGADLRGANLYHTNLGYANLRGADLRGAQIAYASLTHANFKQANLEGLDFASVQAPNANFYQANLRETTFRDMSGYGMKFHGADLTKAEFSNSRTANSIFHEATLDGALFHDLADATNYSLDFAGATLVGAHFEMPRLENFSFRGADLEGALFSYQRQSGARVQVFDTVDFSDANLTHTDLAHSHFHHAIFTDSNWKEADLTGASFYDMEIGGVVYNSEGAAVDGDEAIKLGLFSGFHVTEPGGSRATGGIGNDPNHTLYSKGHRFAGRAPGEHQAARIHEHLTAQHHGEGEVGGAGRRLSRPSSHSPNEGARSSRSSGRASERSDASIRREQLANGARLSETRFGQRPESRIDEAGQAMPFSHGEFRLALNNIRLMGRSENATQRTAGVNDSGFIKINGREYFAKAIVDPYYHPHTEGTNEVVANGIAKMMGLGDHVPAESYHLYFQHPGAEEGHHWSVMSLEKGAQTFEQMENGDGRYHVKLERALRHPDAIKELLFEYIVSNSHGDRHAGNVMFQPSSGRIIHIDFGRAFPHEVEFKPYSNGYISRFFSTQFKIHQDAIDHPTDRGIAEQVKIPHADLAHIRSIGQRILDMAATRGMGLEHPESLDALQTRLMVLEELSFGGDKTVANLMDTAEAYSQ